MRRLAGLLILVPGLSAQDGVPLREGPELCLRCHDPIRALLDLPGAHAPAVDDDCHLCHAPHASRYENMLNRRERALCFLCHRDQATAFQTGNVHTPIREGQCTPCHDPHGSENEALLVEEGTDLCLTCHDEKKAELEAPTTHAPFVDDDCTNCHDAHSSRHESLFQDVVHRPFGEGACRECHVAGEASMALVALGARLCNRCHEDYPRPRDPVIHGPVAEGNCGACHTPHTSDHAELLPQEPLALCTGCHEPIARLFDTASYPHPLKAEEGSCLMCHVPHSSETEALLKADPVRTCLNCHEDQLHGHPVGEQVTDPRTGKGVTCVSCHDPHGSEFPMALLGDRSRGLCLECHMTGMEDGGATGGGRDR